MKKKGGILSGFIVFLLVIVIFGGVGFLGYNIIFKGKMNMNMITNTTTDSTDSTNNTDSTNSNTMNMPNQNGNMEVTEDNNKTYIEDQISQLSKNKQLLNKAIDTIEASIKQMPIDSYQKDSNQQSKTKDINDKKALDSSTSNSTTVNIYAGDAIQQNQSNSGQTYDSDKMQSLHNGIYKASLGTQLLNQVAENIDKQIDQASINNASKTEYYITQYNATLQSKNLLSEAQNYINSAIELLNINPFVDANGLANDYQDMNDVHDSLSNYAEAVVELGQLNTDLINQTVQLANLAQDANSQSQMTSVNMSSGLLSNINISTIFIIILIICAVIFVISLFASVLKMFKSSKPAMDESGNYYD
ncbi:hypothetical protein [Anaeromicropila herbilytica]|uniref:Uncharacterized protein n=1 Tax=Anaeromicropila herbilytica TaxID=2785025 RepID=A0A7R7EIV9_9FIRM|nr:hypothetical protein [Anaeromicropila herbilytica]BCN29580.1 hypothetical protein bsdtb5_08750 [Anaeromicropila herbilytica]